MVSLVAAVQAALAIITHSSTQAGRSGDTLDPGTFDCMQAAHSRCAETTASIALFTMVALCHPQCYALCRVLCHNYQFVQQPLQQLLLISLLCA
jgi:hypothetical protein